MDSLHPNTKPIQQLNKTQMWVVFLVILLDIAVLLDVNIIRQIIGFVFLLLVPGMLILHLMRLKEIGFIEIIVISVGISTAFLMIFGLLINYILLSIGYKTPLSTFSLLVSFNIFVIVFLLLESRIHCEPIWPDLKPNYNNIEKVFFSLALIFPSLSVFGTHVMNTVGNNIILLAILLILSLYIVFILILNQENMMKIYPIAIFSIGLSVVLMISLRSNYIIGTDAHYEYYFFKTTSNNLYWDVLGGSTLDSCLSISLLPTIYKSITNIDAVILFKILFSILFSFCPLIVYSITNQFLERKYSFIAALFLIAQYGFKITPLWARINIAILFFALLILVLSIDEIAGMKKRLLTISFSICILFSHYSTAYIFILIVFAILLVQTFLGTITSNYDRYIDKSNMYFRPTYFCLIFCVLFLWYAKVIHITFDSGVNFFAHTITSMNDLFIMESRSNTLEKAIGKGVSNIPSILELIFSWISIILIGIGALRISNALFSTLILKKPVYELNSGLKKFNMNHIILSLVCFSVLVISVIIPHISAGYGIERVYLQMSVVVSLLFVIGGKELGSFLKIEPSLLLLFALLAIFLSTTGVTYQAFNIPREISMNSEGTQYDNWYVYDHDIHSGKWLFNKWDGNRYIVCSSNGKNVLVEYFGTFSPVRLFNDVGIYPNAYLYLSLKQVRDVDTTFNNSFIYSLKMNNIYNNGGSEVWI